MGVLLSLLKHGGLDKEAEAEAEPDKPSAPYVHAYYVSTGTPGRHEWLCLVAAWGSCRCTLSVSLFLWW
jgi:hypothetical protein